MSTPTPRTPAHARPRSGPADRQPTDRFPIQPTRQTSQRTMASPTRPIQVRDLYPGDHVIVLDVVVEILGVREHPRFPMGRLVRLRPLPSGAVAQAPIETLLPSGRTLTGLHLPRQLAPRCDRCGTPVPTTVDLVLGNLPQVRCGGCVRASTMDTARRYLSLPRRAT